ncbi:OmpA family protein [Pseudophaeobacter sp.]|uniref:OmpA family protein n=1 Tax=Pseudophaeobacter sp. TaxID=1971739 RepID=UPI00329839EE
MVRVNTFAAFVFAAALLPASLVSAEDAQQELTVEEITEAFKKQKTRGLVIVPSAATVDATQDVASEETATIAAAAEEYTPVARQSQINVQISFDFDSAALRPDQQSKLGNMCTSMKVMQDTVFQIIGHTDSSGSARYNERLSLLRAQEVRRHLISACDIDATMLKAIGMGETAPYNQDDPRADENRRVEFQALG